VLTVKLVVVLAVGLGSAVRSLAVGRLRGRGADAATRASLRQLYAATAWSLVLLVALAEVLAHG
jgi:F0F1-type ATP synthase membrane subunit c/vacuolar-type H+-ATPase subunit K